MLLKLESVSYTYMPKTPFERTAIRNITMEIAKGEYLAIIGQTGSGKSTLVQHLNGLLAPTSGRVLLDGQVVGEKKVELAAIRRRVGLLFQFPEQQLFEETVLADVGFGPKNMGLPPQEVDKRVQKALCLVGLDPGDISQRSPFSLSGGQMRRVAMAGVLAMEPEIIILDEPAAGLDPRGRDEILNQIDLLHKEFGQTVILVSHNMDEVAGRAQRLIVLGDGEIKLEGTPAQVFQDAQILEELGLGMPQMALLMHRLRAAGKNVPTAVFTVNEAKLALLRLLGGE